MSRISIQNVKIFENIHWRWFIIRIRIGKRKKSNHRNFSVSLPMVNTYKFCKKEILIKPSGEPREQHLGDVRPKKV